MSIINNRYRIDKELGIGQFGKTKLAYDIVSKEYVAIKIVRKSKMNRITEEKFLKEAKIIQSCNHPHIIKFIDYFNNGNYFIVMEYVEYGELFDHVCKNTFNIIQKKKIIAQLISAIEYCHGNLIVHGDIKLENILISDINRPAIKLIDFGFSSYINLDEQYNSKCGSLQYTAPEIIESSPSFNPMKTDIWSLGVVIYCIINNTFPWRDKYLISDITSYNYAKYDNDNDNNLLDLFNKIFVRTDKRINLSEIKNHQWLEGYIIDSKLPYKPPIEFVETHLVDKLTNLDFNKDNVINLLNKGGNSVEVSIYHLLLDKYKENKIEDNYGTNKSEEINIDKVNLNKGINLNIYENKKKYFSCCY